MIYRPDLLPPRVNSNIEIIQLTNGDVPTSHIYMEAQVFSPDSRRFILHESATPHGSCKDDPAHIYFVCDIDNFCAMQPITEEIGATAPSVSPDGKYLYYFVDETEINGGKLTLKRVCLDGTDRKTLLVIDTPITPVNRWASKIYPLSTMRSDGRKIALSCFLGNGSSEGITWGLLSFDLETLTHELIIEGQTWCNMHPQYCRSTNNKYLHDILIQENHGNICTQNGKNTLSVSGGGVDIHVINDESGDILDMPWGRDGNEYCQGHQCWRGSTNWAITSTGTQSPEEEQLIESQPGKGAGHIGIASPGGIHNHLTRDYPLRPSFYHFSTDIAGRKLISDTEITADGKIVLANLGEPGRDPLSDWSCLAVTHSALKSESHIHPFLSPDGNMAFFNSDESGILQAYMIRGLDSL